jgi:hypothetical protein
MTLPSFATLEDVPEPFRPFAKEADGKFSLDLVPGADVVGLKKKNAQLKEEALALQSKYSGINLDEIETLKATAAKGAELDSRLKLAMENEAKEKQRADTLARRLLDQAKKVEVTQALAAAGANTALLTPVVMQMVDVVEEGDATHVVVRQSDGSVRYRDGAGNRFTVADLLAELKTKDEYKPAFSVAVGSGGGATPSAGAPGVRVIPASDRAAVMQAVQSGDLRAGKVRIA